METTDLARLLGRTRASALAAIAGTCTTSELARLIGVSPPTASHHASALRDAGLITSVRAGGAVYHRVTPLGAALLDVGGGRAWLGPGRDPGDGDDDSYTAGWDGPTRTGRGG